MSRQIFGGKISSSQKSFISLFDNLRSVRERKHPRTKWSSLQGINSRHSDWQHQPWAVMWSRANFCLIFFVIFTLPCHCETSKSIFRSGEKKKIFLKLEYLNYFAEATWKVGGMRVFALFICLLMCFAWRDVCVALKWENMNSKFWLW